MSTADETYAALQRRVMNRGVDRSDRTGTGTRSLFGHQSRYDLREGFPLLTTKRVHFKSVVTELLWFLRGDTNTEYLHEHGCKIWDEWADEYGDLGPVYGHQWRSWMVADEDSRQGLTTIDQIANVIEQIKADPYSRRHIVSAWNPAEVEDMALPPCHLLFQFYVEPVADGPDRLSCQLYQRSGDVFLGVPFNIASYALLTHMIAQVCGLDVGEFVHTLGDAHIYSNHFEQVEEQLMRVGRDAPTLLLREGVMDIDAFTHEDITLISYDPHPTIKAKVAV